MAFSLYILQCSDGTLYIGHTDNLDERMRQHDAGKADSYTASRRPLKLLHAEGFETRYEALTMERKLKGWTKAKKLAYIAGDWEAVSRLARNRRHNEGEFDRRDPPVHGESVEPPAAKFTRSPFDKLRANGSRVERA